VETFKLSKDPLFIDAVCDIVGLYLAPPEHRASSRSYQGMEMFSAVIYGPVLVSTYP
jgi:hypothetical protein